MGHVQAETCRKGPFDLKTVINCKQNHESLKIPKRGGFILPSKRFLSPLKFYIIIMKLLLFTTHFPVTLHPKTTDTAEYNSNPNQ